MKRRFWNLNSVCGLLLAVLITAGGVVVWQVAKGVQAGQRRLAEVAALDADKRWELFQACLGLANREEGIVESADWPAALAALNPEKIWVLEDQVRVRFNSGTWDHAALMLSRSGEADAWRLYLVDFDGTRVVWPLSERPDDHATPRG